MTNRINALIGPALMTGVLLVLPALPGWADDFQGANGLLKKLDDLKKPEAVAAASSAASKESAVQFVKNLKAFSNSSGSLSSDQAAKEWMDLFERAQKLQANIGRMDEMGGMASAPRATFSVLTGPAAWPALQKQVESRTSTKQGPPTVWPALHLIMDTLNNEESSQWTDLAQLADVPPGAQSAYGSYSGESGDSFIQAGTALSEMSSQPGEVEKFWTAALGRMEHGKASPSDAGDSRFDLPDLVTILGEAKAEPLVLKALLLVTHQISNINGLATEELARKLALTNVDKLARPPWFLTGSLEGAPLYEALRKRFPNDSGNQAYALYYVLSLVVSGKADEAAKVDVDVDMSQLEDATEQVANAGWQPQVYDFIHAYLEKHPESSLWTFYVQLAAQTGHSDDALKFIRDTDARTDLNEEGHVQVRSVLYRALLAVDKVDEGVDELRLLIKSGKAKLTASSTPSASNGNSIDAALTNISQAMAIAGKVGTSSNPREQIVRWDIALARIGHLLKREELEKEGLDGAMQIVRDIPEPQPGSNGGSQDQNVADDLINYLMETGRYAQAEDLVIKEMVQQARILQTQSEDNQRNFDYETRENLLKLALIYYEAGRWADIITLLEKAPGWGAKDLISVATQGSYISRRSTPHLDLMAARALAETGRVAEALPILDYTLQEDSGNDAAYALLLKIGKGDLVAKLDALYRLDQFQERPLIWKAVALLQQGKVDDAEAACKAAIAVDPSDGEEGKGDRMRVYSVMADVCEAKKDAKQAEFFRNVVKAIRLSEDADDYYDAGLLTQAVTMYGHALTLFSDAYCIQSRIARQLAELGRTEEAAVHYRKAFELMPVSFGRLESHCFGCERAFKGRTAVEIAQKTFTEMMAKDPKKPQIPYLLGYLYMEQENYKDALVNFQKAAELDPDYINAWKHIVEIGEKYQLSPDVRDSAVFNLLRLDPAGRHVTPSTDHVRQLGKLWDAEIKAAAAIPPVPKKLMHLDASAAQGGVVDDDPDSIVSQVVQASGPDGMKPEMKAWMDLQQMGINLGRETYRSPGQQISPLTVILGNKVIACALNFL